MTNYDARIAAIEARQRAHGQHDPDCTKFEAALRGVIVRLVGAKWERVPCDCWLSR